jgi:hypothetical protein
MFHLLVLIAEIVRLANTHVRSDLPIAFFGQLSEAGAYIRKSGIPEKKA